ncbi:MAG: aldehyde-activating protein [Thiotrichales bacterium SG8_50]|nr:MAG: aldehyde-activating protein [Thiotrichales bacterium SG8_50]
MNYTGSCLCKAVQFEIFGGIRNIVFCHCSRCRKAQGSAYATNGIVDTTNFKINCGEDELTAYVSSSKQTKYFCRHCGSPIMSQNEARPDQVRVRLGTIDGKIAERPEAHIFVTSKANWDEICDNLPQFESYEPGR